MSNTKTVNQTSTLGWVLNDAEIRSRRVAVLPTASEIRQMAQPKLIEYDEFRRDLHEFLDTEDVQNNLEDFVLAASELQRMLEECRSKRLQALKPHKAKSKDVENVFLRTEKALANELERLKIELGKVLPKEQVEWRAQKVISSDIDWAKLGTHLTESNVLRAANLRLEEFGEFMNGIEYSPMAKVSEAMEACST